MRAYELHARAGLDALTRTTRESPSLSPTDVRVRIRAAALNYRDLAMLRGAHNRVQPVVPLSDGAGEVIEVGDEVTRVAIGDRVAASFFPTWIDGELSADAHAHALGGAIDGTLRDEMTLDQSIEATRFGGAISLLGVLSGVRGDVNVYSLFYKALRVRGLYVGSVTMFEALAAFVTRTGVRPVIDRVFEFDEARAAYEHLAQAGHVGKIVIRVA